MRIKLCILILMTLTLTTGLAMAGPGMVDFPPPSLAPLVPDDTPQGDRGDPILCQVNSDIRDNSWIIQDCLNDAPPGAIVELPPGQYGMMHKVTIAKRVTLRTQGKKPNSKKCSMGGYSGCAELIASPELNDAWGMVSIDGEGIAINHIIFDGNKDARRNSEAADACAAGYSAKGYTVMANRCVNCTFTNNVFKNALCASGMAIRANNTTITKNTFAYNGIHEYYMWADGLTFNDGSGNTIQSNLFMDNTDIDLVFGGCQRCLVQDNKIRHSNSFQGSAFAALMLQAWTDGKKNLTSGNYTDSDISNNDIDCGKLKRCGFGLYVGSDAWAPSNIFGGNVHDNDIANTGSGVVVDDAHDVTVSNNSVTGTADTLNTACGTRQGAAYSIGGRSYDVVLAPNPDDFAKLNWDHCIPNWYR